MKQTASIISTYTADISGVCSALFELGGMTVMHDASGCNSTYNTHDEPRWYHQDSLVFLSGLSEMDAIMGDDEKLIRDIVEATEQFHPAFIAIAGSPIPMMTGTDFPAVATLVEQRTGIPAFGFPTNGMHTYISGAGMAFAGLAERFVTKKLPNTDKLSVNLLGVTPLDFSVNTTVQSMKEMLLERGIETASCWAMGDTLENLCQSSRAYVNLVVSYCGMQTARILQRRFGIPYVVGRPCGKFFTDRLAEDIRASAADGRCRCSFTDGRTEQSKIAVIGEGVFGGSLAAAIEAETGRGVRSIAATEFDTSMLSHNDVAARDEAELLPCFQNIRILIADPLYRPICPADVKFIGIGHEGFSGRIFRNEIPDLAKDIMLLLNQIQ